MAEITDANTTRPTVLFSLAGASIAPTADLTKLSGFGSGRDLLPLLERTLEKTLAEHSWWSEPDPSLPAHIRAMSEDECGRRGDACWERALGIEDEMSRVIATDLAGIMVQVQVLALRRGGIGRAATD